MAVEKPAHGTPPAEAGRGTLLLFGHATCFFPDPGSSQTQLLFLLLLPALSPTCTQWLASVGLKDTRAPRVRCQSLTPWLSHLVVPHCFQQHWQRSREDRMASDPLVELSTEFLLTSREPPCNLAQGPML